MASGFSIRLTLALPWEWLEMRPALRRIARCWETVDWARPRCSVSSTTPVLAAVEVTQDRQACGVPQDVEQRGHGSGLVHGAVVLGSVLGEQPMFHRHKAMLFAGNDERQGR